MQEKKMTGYPSIDKPWLKYYTDEIINIKTPEKTIYEYLRDCNADYLDSVALNYFDNNITYSNLFKHIESAAKAFVGIGVVDNDIVTLCTVTLPETIYSLYALNQLGAVANMTDPRTSIDGLREYLNEVKSKYVVCIDVAYPKIVEAVKGTSVEKIIVISPADSLSLAKKAAYKMFKAQKLDSNSNTLTWKEFISDGKNESFVPVPYQPNKCCAIVHTGGTTGTPKGVMLSNENFNEMVISFTYNGLSFEPNRILLSIMPPFIAYGLVNGVHVVLCRSMKIVMVPLFDPAKLDELVLKYHPSHMLATPTHYEVLINSDKVNDETDLSFIKMTGIGGDGLHINTENRLNQFFESHNCTSKAIKGYGMTEVSAAACASRPENNTVGSIGLPFVKVIISAFEPDTDKELKYGEKGELCIHSPSTMIGYYNNQEETNKILRRHSDGKMWIHSGDIGYVTEDGNVYIEGRIKRMIIRNDGFKVFPVQIERVLMDNENVETCCVVATPDKEYSHGSLPLAFVVKAKNSEISNDSLKNELAQMCQKELPEYVQPVDYVFIDKLPLTPIGKVDYRSLEKEAEEMKG